MKIMIASDIHGSAYYCKEMINAFKNWDYIPFNLQLDILDDLFEQENIPYEEHPYGVKKKRNKTKIIKIDFNGNK